jgi:hypothetical protein
MFIHVILNVESALTTNCVKSAFGNGLPLLTINVLLHVKDIYNSIIQTQIQQIILLNIVYYNALISFMLLFQLLKSTFAKNVLIHASIAYHKLSASLAKLLFSIQIFILPVSKFALKLFLIQVWFVYLVTLHA